MNILEMRGIEKSFHGVKVLKDVDFSVKSGEVHALCGENGAGKSTLMKILIGIYKSDKGKVVFKEKQIQASATVMEIQQMGISMIFQELNLLNELTVAQNIFLMREKTKKSGMLNEKEMIEKAGALLAELEPIDPTEKVRELGIAQKQIVEIAKAISYNADLRIMDEPTAVLTKKEVDLLFGLIRKLKERGVTIIYISHRLPEIVEICDRITVLRDGAIVETRDLVGVTQRDIARMMVGREVEIAKVEEFDPVGKKEALRVENLSAGNLVKNVSFSLTEGEILGFYGLVGAGRSEMAETIFGIRKRDGGEVYVRGEKTEIFEPKDAIAQKIAFVTEDRRGSGLFEKRSIVENLTTVKNVMDPSRILNKKQEMEITKEMTEAFHIKYDSEETEVINLSGGNQQKIVFGKWVAGDADIYIFDEPTRGVDVGARKEIYNYIGDMAREGKAIIIISSDITELLETANRIIVMYQGVITGELSHDESSEERIMMFATGIEGNERMVGNQ